MFRDARRYIMISTSRAIMIYLTARRVKLIKVCRRTGDRYELYTVAAEEKQISLQLSILRIYSIFYIDKIARLEKMKNKLN